VAEVQVALGELFGSYSHRRQHAFTRDLLVLDVDLSPLPASKQAEGSERGSMGRQLVRVRAADTQEIVWETVIAGRMVASLLILQEALHAPRLHQFGIVRLIGQGWAIPGRIKLTDKGVVRVRLRRAHPRTRDVCCGFGPLLANSHIEVVMG
jgi:hypothetical protein